MNQLESAEDYLERILMLKTKNGNVRALDIAKDMNYTKASVSIALKKLKAKEYIIVDERTGSITLTESGYNIASQIYDRHDTISKFLISLGVDEKIALEDACKIEHDLSEETFLAIKKSLEK